jgi:hypothetical protein
VEGVEVFFCVKSEVPSDKVDEFTGKLASGELKGIEGNTCYVSLDGSTGYDIIECRDEKDCRQRYNHLTLAGLRILEMQQVEPFAQFLDQFSKAHKKARKAA